MTVHEKDIRTFREMFEDYCNAREGCPNPDISIGCDFCAKEVVKEYLKRFLYPDPRKDELEYWNNVTVNQIIKDLDK